MDQQDDPYQSSKRPAPQEPSQWPLYASAAPVAHAQSPPYNEPTGSRTTYMSQQPLYSQPQPPMPYDPSAMLYSQPPPQQQHHHHHPPPPPRQYRPPGPPLLHQGNPYAPMPPPQRNYYSHPPNMAYAATGPPQPSMGHPPQPQQPTPPQQPPIPTTTQTVAAAPYSMSYHPLLASAPKQPQPIVGRRPADRPLIKLSVSLIDTYKHINTIYYEERDARRAQRAKEKKQQQQQGTTPAGATANNHGWDDENYDYIITPGEIFYGRYKIMERIGKGSFGQVVRAEDIETKREVAIKIIKSKKPFLLQAKTEIELLTVLFEKDPDDQHNLVRLLTHFMYRNHQCLVFEMLSLNLYELLKNTQFGGVSLNLIKKFAKQVLKALTFLARKDVDIIHCDLKPENILLRHPKKSAVKVIDFGSSCRSNKRMYSYIQSRFYRSPEVMLGLPYSVAIDMWSLGCILAEMHTGEPLFSGSDQFDQMQKIVKLLGMVPDSMLEKASDSIKYQFFEKVKTPSGRDEWQLRQSRSGKKGSDAGGGGSPVSEPTNLVTPSLNPIASLSEVITAGSRQKKKYPPSETYNSQRNYELFIDLVYKMLAYRPEERIQPAEALRHPFLASSDVSPTHASSVNAATSSTSVPSL